MKNKIKFLLLSVLIILYPVLLYFSSGSIGFGDLILNASIAIGTLIVFFYSNKYGLLLWISALAIQSVFSIFIYVQMWTNENPALLVFLIATTSAICLACCRLALQWTTSLWLNPEGIPNSKAKILYAFWLMYLSFEVAAVLLSIALMNILFFDNKFSLISILVVGMAYKFIRKTSLRTLSPYLIQQEKKTNELDLNAIEDKELKNSLERILSTSNLHDLKSIFFHELQRFPHMEPVLSKAYDKHSKVVSNEY